MAKKYGIVFDNGIIRSEGEKVILDQVFSRTFDEVKDFIEKNKAKTVSMYLPEIVLKEAINQRSLRIAKIIRTIAEGFEGLKRFNVDIPDNKYKELNYEKLLKEKSEEYLSKKEVSLISLPDNDILQETIERSLKHKRPFREEGDKGLKDTILWLSVIHFFKKTDLDVCVLVSLNKKDFNDTLTEEFVDRTGKQIVFIETIQDLKEYLDKEIPLNLHLQKLHNDIENAIKSKWGDIIFYLNKTQLPYQEVDNYGYGGEIGVIDTFLPAVNANVYLNPSVYGTSEKNEKEVIAYTPNDLIIKDIKNISNENYQVELAVTVDERYKPEKREEASLWGIYSHQISLDGIFPKTRLFLITASYNLVSKEIKIKSCIGSPRSSRLGYL